TSGLGGDVTVIALGDVLVNGSGVNGSGATLPTGIVSNAQPGSIGRAGSVTLSGQNITVGGGGLITSGTAGAGTGGIMQEPAQASLTLTDLGSGIIASASSTGGGDAGSVTVNAPQITLTAGAEIAGTTAGTGAGGSVNVTTPGALVLDGFGIANTQIASSATG